MQGIPPRHCGSRDGYEDLESVHRLPRTLWRITRPTALQDRHAFRRRLEKQCSISPQKVAEMARFPGKRRQSSISRPKSLPGPTVSAVLLEIDLSFLHYRSYITAKTILVLAVFVSDSPPASRLTVSTSATSDLIRLSRDYAMFAAPEDARICSSVTVSLLVRICGSGRLPPDGILIAFTLLSTLGHVAPRPVPSVK